MPKRTQEVTLSSMIVQQETEHLLNIFPEVVWLRVADHLYENVDVLNLINSSRFFRNLLLHKRVTTLFEPVFQILTEYVARKNKTKPNTWTNESEVKSLILNCRLVCRSWNYGIEHLLKLNPDWDIQTIEVFETEIPLNLLLSKKSSVVVSQILTKCFDFSSCRTQQISKFITKFGYCDFNYPHTFLGSGILINIDGHKDDDDIVADFCQIITAFLDIFGQHVLHCTINLKYNIDSNETYLNIIERLGAAPNLQNLFIISKLSRPTICAITPTIRHPLPTWKKLQSVTFRNINVPLCNAIICNAPKLNKLCIQRYSFGRCIGNLNLGRRFENLEQFELWDCSWQEIRSIRWSSFPLKRFNLKVTSRDDDQVASLINWVELFQLLSEKMGQTLEELMLELPYLHEKTAKRFSEESHIARLNMPKVKRMYLSVRNSCSLDFLLGMTKSLEWLHISVDTWERMQRNKEKESVEIWSYRDHLNESNIWSLFPKLETVEMTELEREWVGNRQYICVEGKLCKWVKTKRNSENSFVEKVGSVM